MSKVYSILVVALILLGRPGLLSAQETPVDLNEDEIMLLAGGSYTDFVETTYDDPNWVLVISDSILRANTCVASDPGHPYGWYEKVFNPCYNYNRYWKLATGAKTGRAFPMSAFGPVGNGTLDSLYVREGFGFQLYYNTEEPEDPNDLLSATPYLGGARYVSLTCW